MDCHGYGWMRCHFPFFAGWPNGIYNDAEKTQMLLSRGQPATACGPHPADHELHTVLLETGVCIHLHAVRAIMAELSSRNETGHKAKNVFYLALYRKVLPTLLSNHEVLAYSTVTMIVVIISPQQGPGKNKS